MLIIHLKPMATCPEQYEVIFLELPNCIVSLDLGYFDAFWFWKILLIPNRFPNYFFQPNIRLHYPLPILQQQQHD